MPFSIQQSDLHQDEVGPPDHCCCQLSSPAEHQQSRLAPKLAFGMFGSEVTPATEQIQKPVMYNRSKRLSPVELSPDGWSTWRALVSSPLLMCMYNVNVCMQISLTVSSRVLVMTCSPVENKESDCCFGVTTLMCSSQTWSMASNCQQMNPVRKKDASASEVLPS